MRVFLTDALEKIVSWGLGACQALGAWCKKKIFLYFLFWGVLRNANVTRHNIMKVWQSKRAFYKIKIPLQFIVGEWWETGGVGGRLKKACSMEGANTKKPSGAHQSKQGGEQRK